ncbi:integrase [Actinoplanes sp. NPDC049118]|uniref:integrase n=1 Tax=Actinoplanes sp. NPDC049118 TaxID=3155769 RepID=UPI0033DC8C02
MKTRLRRLRIGARTFVWRAEIRHVQAEHDCHRCIRVRAWGGDKRGRVLQADLLSTTWPSPWTACATDGAYPTAGDVRPLIGYALEHGWQPDLRGGEFILSEREHSARFSLPGFLLTDRLCTADSPDPTAQVIAAYEARPRD